MILVLGARGQVGSAWVASLPRVLSWTRDDLDFSDLNLLRSRLQEASHVTAVVNAAAFTAVDLAESQREMALRLNAEMPGIVADYCQSRGIPLVHYSTDYVYSGRGDTPWREEDPVDPCNYYGLTKLEGENRIRASGCLYFIFRTSWVYDAQGKNFFRTMIRLAREREELKVVADQVGAPTYAPDLVRASHLALQVGLNSESFPVGTYNLAGSGTTSWWGFASEIVKTAPIPLRATTVRPIATEDFPTPARRPLNSRMALDKFERSFVHKMPHWEDGLARCWREWKTLNP